MFLSSPYLLLLDKGIRYSEKKKICIAAIDIPKFNWVTIQKNHPSIKINQFQYGS